MAPPIRHAWVLGRPTDDATAKKRWIAQCLDLNLSATGSSLLDALDLLEEAVADAIRDDRSRGREPFERRPAEASDWEQLWAVVRCGVLVTEEELAMSGEPLERIATQLAITTTTNGVRRSLAALVPSDLRV